MASPDFCVTLKSKIKLLNSSARPIAVDLHLFINTVFDIQSFCIYLFDCCWSQVWNKPHNCHCHCNRQTRFPPTPVLRSVAYLTVYTDLLPEKNQSFNETGTGLHNTLSRFSITKLVDVYLARSSTVCFLFV